MSTLEQEIILEITKLNQESQRRVLDFIHSLTPPTVDLERRYTARELLQLPLEQRNLIIRASLERVANEDIELFEAYSEGDFDDDNL